MAIEEQIEVVPTLQTKILKQVIYNNVTELSKIVTNMIIYTACNSTKTKVTIESSSIGSQRFLCTM